MKKIQRFEYSHAQIALKEFYNVPDDFLIEIEPQQPAWKDVSRWTLSSPVYFKSVWDHDWYWDDWYPTSYTIK